MLQTLAVKIDEDSYNIAVACLSAGFINVPKEKAIGSYLVINEPTFKLLESGENIIVISNSWTSEVDFHEHYIFITEAKGEGQFSPIERIL